MPSPVRNVAPGPPAVVVDGISKRFPADRVAALAPTTSMFGAYARRRRHRGVVRTPDAEIWALRQVSFEVGRGEALGVIGPSGAGKTTLLRVLARLSLPTSGQALVRGRVSPLVRPAANLMRPELDPRENVLAVGRVFGFDVGRIRRRTDDVLRLAGVSPGEDFRRSRDGGDAFRRLAAAAAVELDPDVLLFDEFPKAADPEFSERLLRRVESALEQGVALILATRDPALVRSLCRRALWLDDGGVVRLGQATAVVDEFQATVKASATVRPAADVAGPRSGFNRAVALLAAEPRSSVGSRLETARPDEEVHVRIDVETALPQVEIRCVLVLEPADARAIRIEQPEPAVLAEPGLYVLTAHVPPSALPEGEYVAHVEAAISANGKVGTIGRAGIFRLRALGLREGPEEEPSLEPAPDPEPWHGARALEEIWWSIDRDGPSA